MSTPTAPTAPFTPPVPAGSLGVSDVAAQAFRSAAQELQQETAAFFPPPGSEIDYVLYATPVRSDLGLVAFFTMETPLGNARRAGQALVQSIVRPSAAGPQVEPPGDVAASLPRDRG